MIDVNKIITYEAGEMDLQETVSLFQEMINSGIVWSLQGHYGRTAQTLIENGMCIPVA